MDQTRSLIDLGAGLPAAQLCSLSNALGLVVFAHTAGEDRRGRSFLSSRFEAQRLDTLVADLLAPGETLGQGEGREDVEHLAQRLQHLLERARSPRHSRLGLIASDRTAAAALVVAARCPSIVRAVVSRGGRLDLVADVLGDVRAPTLLLVGGADPEMLQINRTAMTCLRCEKRIDVVPRATRRFLEAGSFDVVAERAGEWFRAHLPAPAA